MCLIDWQLGRLIRAFPRMATVSSTPAVIAVPNNDRVAISFASFDNGTNVAVMPKITQVSATGIGLEDADSNTVGADPVLFHVTHFMHFTLKDHGELPTVQWMGYAGGESSILVIEYLLPEDVLWLTPDQLRARNSNYGK